VGRIAKTGLTARQVQTASKPGCIADGAQPGLNSQVTTGSSGISRSWVFRYTSPTTRKRQEMGLGSVDARSLTEARELVSKLRLIVLNGNDPKEVRDSERREQQLARSKQLTFKEAAAQCIATKEHEWRNAKHAAQWSSSLETYAYPVIGSSLASEITTEDILRLLEPIWTTKPRQLPGCASASKCGQRWLRLHDLKSPSSTV